MGYVMGVGDWGHLLIVGATKSNQQGGGKEGETQTHIQKERAIALGNSIFSNFHLHFHAVAIAGVNFICKIKRNKL